MTAGRARPGCFLARHRDARLLWAGETASLLGGATTALLLPLVALVELDADASVIALLEAALWLPWLLVGLPAGAAVDRLPARAVIVACDLAGAAALLSVPIAAVVDRLTIAHLLVVAGLVGTRAVFAEPALYAYLPALVDADDLPAANALFEGSESAAEVAGPAAAGVVAAAVGAATALLLDVVSYLASAVCVLRIGRRVATTPSPGGTGLAGEVVDGLRLTAGDPYLRVLALTGVLANFSITGMGALAVPFLVRTNGVTVEHIGFLVGVGGLGGVVGAASVSRFVRSLGSARVVVVGTAVGALGGLLMAAAAPGAGLALYVVGSFAQVAAVAAANVVTASFTQRYCPRHVLGRVVVTARTAAYSAAPAGAVAAAALASAVGPRGAMAILAVCGLTPVAVQLGSALGRHRDLPDRPDRSEPVPAEVTARS